MTLQSDQFRSWFGRSQITKTGMEGGEPLTVYHGTSSDFAELKPSSHGEYGPGIYLSYRPESAAMWGRIAGGRGGEVRVMSLYLKMEKPYRTTKLELQELALEEGGDGEPIGMREVHRRLKAQGYDGIIGTGLTQSDVQLIAFESSQVVLADGGERRPDIVGLDMEGDKKARANSSHAHDSFDAGDFAL